MFCFDTSSLLECWSRCYPLDVFPGIWARLSYLIEGGDVTAPDEVNDEIKHKDDGLAEWLKQRTSMFVALEGPVQVAAREVLAEFPELVKALGGRKVDPFVIGLGARPQRHSRDPGAWRRPRAAANPARLRALWGAVHRCGRLHPPARLDIPVIPSNLRAEGSSPSRG